MCESYAVSLRTKVEQTTRARNMIALSGFEFYWHLGQMLK